MHDDGGGKPGYGARAVAARLLAAVVDRKVPLDGMVDPRHGNAGFKALSDPDRALARAMTVTALRHLPRIEAALALLVDHPLPEGARALHHVLAIAAAQILYLDVPAHSAVDLAVEQAQRDPRSRRFAALVNAVLRRLVREKDAIAAQIENVAPMPDWFLSRLEAAYGKAEAGRIAAAQLSPAPIDLTVKSDAAGWAQRLGGTVLPTGSVRLSPFEGQVSALAGFGDGEWWVQDAAASIPARLFGPVKDLRVADLCAAPGGKTAQLAAAGARVVAVEQSSSRFERLRENLARLKLDAELVGTDLFTLAPDALFDAVLLDAPCSSTGTTRRHPDVLWTKGPQDIEKLAALQARMLAHAATLVRPGGLLVFSNCSLDPLEGEAVVEDFLGRNPDFARKPVSAADWPGLEKAITDKGDFRTTPAMLSDPGGEAGAGRFSGGMDGFYACVLQRL